MAHHSYIQPAAAPLFQNPGIHAPQLPLQQSHPDWNKQYYANHAPYSHAPSPAPSSTFIQPHPSPDPHLHSRQAPIQQHVPNHPLARASSAFMPPPQRPNSLWPRELSEEQRQIQDQYIQNASAAPSNPYYAQQPASTAAASLAPITSFTPSTYSQPTHYPRQHTQSPAATSQRTPSMTAASLPIAAPIPAAQPPPTVTAPIPEPAALQPPKPIPAQTPNPQPPQSNTTQPQQPAAPVPAIPQPQLPSPYEAQRVSALLDINRFLLLELNFLQSKPLLPMETPKSDHTKAPQSSPNPPSSPHYVDYMRRLQSNLAYLASVADRPHKPLNPIPAWPMIMNPPARKGGEEINGGEESEAETEVRERYEGLKELWPEWKGKATA